MPAGDFIPTAHIALDVVARDKKRALKHLADLAADKYALSSRTVCHALLEREQFGTTAVGSGMAMPHARLQGLDKAHAFFVRLREPVEFDAPDGQGVDLMFMLLSPTHADTDHVKALAALSRLCRSRTCTQALREASDVGAVHGILQQAAKDE